MGRTARVDLTLPEELERFVAEEVRRGGFGSSADYFREVLYDRLRSAERLDAFDRAIDEGLADLDSGRSMTLDEAFERLEAELDLPPGP